MRRSRIATRRDLERVYGPEVGDFVPTHLVRIFSVTDRVVLRLDYVKLGPPNEKGLRFGFVPNAHEPSYAVLSSGKWQSLDVHGLLHDEIVRYFPDYVPPKHCSGYVYFIQAGDGPIKIGWSQDVSRRLAELQTANAMKLHLLGSFRGRMEAESRVHEELAHLRMEGEWFRDAPELRDLMRQGR